VRKVRPQRFRSLAQPASTDAQNQTPARAPHQFANRSVNGSVFKACALSLGAWYAQPIRRPIADEDDWVWRTLRGELRPFVEIESACASDSLEHLGPRRARVGAGDNRIAVPATPRMCWRSSSCGGVGLTVSNVWRRRSGEPRHRHRETVWNQVG
jgi:hypothetical protein